MKIEKLNENKLKITLDVNDLKSRNIDVKSFISNTPESQDLFWDVMQEAEREYGFNVDESMVYVEAHINSTGLFTLIITKQAGTVQTKSIKKTSKPFNFKLKRKEPLETFENSLFEFADINSLSIFCKFAKPENYTDTSLYKYNGSFYLFAKNCTDKKILEYSNRVSEKNLKFAKIFEYGDLLLKDEEGKYINSYITKITESLGKTLDELPEVTKFKVVDSEILR